MKIAVCYSGNIRTYEHCVINHSNLLDNVDVYISTWSDFLFSNSINDSSHYKIKIQVPEQVTEDYLVEKTPKNFNIRSIKIDSYDIKLKKIKNNPLYPQNRMQGLSYQYFKIKDCYDLLKKSGQEYDFVIRLRPDITVERFHFTKDKITFEKNIWHNNPFSTDKYAINEMIWTSDMNLMEKSCKIYENIELINDLLPNDLIFGEAFCYRNLMVENIVDRLEINNFDYRVIR